MDDFYRKHSNNTLFSTIHSQLFFAPQNDLPHAGQCPTGGEDGAVWGLGAAPANGTALGGARDVLPPSCMASGAQPEPSTEQPFEIGGGTTREACCRGVLSRAVVNVTSGSSAVTERTGGSGSGDVEGASIVCGSDRPAMQKPGEQCRSKHSQIYRGCPPYRLSIMIIKFTTRRSTNTKTTKALAYATNL